VATWRGDEGDTDSYTDAIREFDEALRLDDTMKLPLGAREGSLRLSPREGSLRLSPHQRAAVLYSRGYAQVRLFEKSGRWRNLPRIRPELLRAAQDDFQDALDCDKDHFRAQRALDKLGGPFQELPKRLLDEWAPRAIAVLALAILVYVQVMFLLHRVGDTSYAALTFGLFMFIVAGLYLPEISKLKVGAAELQKSVSEEPLSRVDLGISRSESLITSVRAFAAPVPLEADVPPMGAEEAEEGLNLVRVLFGDLEEKSAAVRDAEAALTAG
jgi:hypothetical protein